MSRAQSTLFGLHLSESGRVLIDKTAAHVELLREAGVLGPAHELEAALVSDLAESLVRAPGYSKAALAQQLTAAIDRLPVLASDDAWDSWATLARNLHTPRHRTAPPLYATQPTPGAAHAADGVALVAAGLGIAYHAKPKAAAAADAAVRVGDLTSLLWVQGVPRAEWVDG